MGVKGLMASESIQINDKNVLYPSAGDITGHAVEMLDTSAGTGKLCILGHLGLVFIWSCFVSCLLFLLFYVSLRNLCSGTCRKIRNVQHTTCVLACTYLN